MAAPTRPARVVEAARSRGLGCTGARGGGRKGRGVRPAAATVVAAEAEAEAAAVAASQRQGGRRRQLRRQRRRSRRRGVAGGGGSDAAVMAAAAIGCLSSGVVRRVARARRRRRRRHPPPPRSRSAGGGGRSRFAALPPPRLVPQARARGRGRKPQMLCFWDGRTNRRTNAQSRYRAPCQFYANSLILPAAAEKPPGAAPTSYLAGSAISGGFKKRGGVGSGLRASFIPHKRSRNKPGGGTPTRRCQHHAGQIRVHIGLISKRSKKQLPELGSTIRRQKSMSHMPFRHIEPMLHFPHF